MTTEKELAIPMERLDRFPTDFMLQFTREEYKSLRFQFGTLKRGQHVKYLPYVFTEHGALMTANVLNSPPLRCHSEPVETRRGRSSCSGNSLSFQTSYRKELKERLDVHEAAIVTILQRVMDVIDPPARP